ncbi:MAG: TVP38/TMEM64 family protein [Anaerolineae bacterium]
MSGLRPRQPVWLRLLLATGLIGLLAALLWLLGRQPTLLLFLDRERLVAWVASLGPWGPLGIIGLQIVQIVAAPVPGQLVGIASGLLFGPWLGACFNMIGVLLGNLLALLLARRCGRPLVRRLVPASALARLDRLTAAAGLPIILAIYLLPFLPGDSITLVAGLTPIPLRHIMLAVAIGRLPGILLSSWVGASAAQLSRTQWILAGVAVSAGIVLVLAFRSRLQDRMWQLVDGLVRRRERGSLARGGQALSESVCAADDTNGARPRPVSGDRGTERDEANP